MYFESNIRTGIEDAGKDNLITNRAILKILEQVGAYHSDSVGYGLLDIEKNGVSWVIVDWQVKVIKRPMYGENIMVRTWARNAKKVSTYRDYELCDDNGNILAIATTKWALIDIHTKKITQISEDILNKYTVEDRCAFLDTLDKIKIPSNPISYKLYDVRRNDIDINEHMHNTNYIDVAYDALPKEIYDKRPFDNFRITYKNEIKLGDIVRSEYYIEGNTHYIVMKNNETNVIHSIVELKK